MLKELWDDEIIEHWSLYNVESTIIIYLSLVFIFLLIDFLFIGLTLSAFTEIEFFHYFAAVSEFGIALFAFYGFGAHIVNHQFETEILPLGKPIL